VRDAACGQAERTLGSLDEERRRVRGLLTSALESLQLADEPADSVLADLSARLRSRDQG
jgi:hypothetical protein